ncbi:VCBS repeat-containing protein [Actinomadura darangshiensis]|uniref:VCBS repeat-containing protein n=1 Tax=Actinomadura darangshiensis TaxID=705336 RepID=A0A4R5B5N4_9ACTN|nr:CRTAC1 family protein [Actinomadura darangshiensis]TDD81151.1 VCBS repeat-containing protein [Actinomadura darangshiensis]
MRRSVPAATALVLFLVLYLVARTPGPAAGDGDATAGKYRFTAMPIAMPPGYRPVQTVRKVNPAYHHIRSWISSVGAAIALNDLTGHGRDDGLCLVDPRTDQVVVTYAPTAPAADRFTPFTLDPAPLPMDAAMAPMGCTPGDYNQDGRTDLLVYYWGRTPIMFLARADAGSPSAASYRPVEPVPTASPDGRYHGPRWNTDAVNVADLDGDGRPDVHLANYFPDSDVLDPHGQANVVMNSSMSDAKNGGGTHVLRWSGGTAGKDPTVSYVEQRGAVPFDASTGWTLAISSADLTGDGRPEVYVANDFGKDHLFYNTSTKGRISFTEATGQRTPATAKSFALGHDSFKGMGVDFGDLGRTGRFDIVVSNITEAWGLEESNLVFVNRARSEAAMRRALARGDAPFDQRARKLGMAWTGWGWDVKSGDFLNSGRLDVVQADGFVKGKINRWPWLQEMAMNNDEQYTNPAMWPHVQPGDDVAGSDTLAFYAQKPGGSFVNVGKRLGLDVPIPTRGVATADTRANGALDFALARQWGPPAFYANTSPNLGNRLGLHLYRPVPGAKAGANLQGPGTPAYGATVRIQTPAGTQISQLDGGGGHSGRRSFEVRFGLGSYSGPVTARIRWADQSGAPHDQTVRLPPGDHTLLLGNAVEEAPSS